MSLLFSKMSNRGGFELKLTARCGTPAIKSYLFNTKGDESCVHLMALDQGDIDRMRKALDVLEAKLKG